ncbi:MAG: head-tail adaptor protein [Phycisphaerae bacterium]|nr:head-tail adaptor protein [Phycisphaerae bacterium]
MSLLLLCAGQISVQRAAVSTDAAGGVVRRWQAIATNIPATILTLRASANTALDRRGIVTTHLIISPDNPGARIGDRVSDGTCWYLVKFTADLGDRGRAWAIFAQLIDPQS